MTRVDTTHSSQVSDGAQRQAELLARFPTLTPPLLWEMALTRNDEEMFADLVREVEFLRSEWIEVEQVEIQVRDLEHELMELKVENEELAREIEQLQKALDEKAA